MSGITKGDRSRWVRVATIAAILVASSLCILKAVGWFMTGSTAVLGSLADSSIDLLASVAAAVAARFAANEPDDNHKFGHHKAEALFAMGQVVLISVSATLVIWESVQRFYVAAPLNKPDIAVGSLAISLVATLILVTFQSIAVKKTDSLIIKSDRAHYLGDVFALSGALAAVLIGETYGIPRLDAIAGLVMGVFLGHSAIQVTRIAIPQLMDQELPEDDKNRIKAILDNNPQVKGYHALRTRKAGGKRFIQLDILLDASLSFRKAHDITDAVELSLEAAFSDTDVIIHADPVGEARPERRVVEDVEDYGEK